MVENSIGATYHQGANIHALLVSNVSPYYKKVKNKTKIVNLTSAFTFDVIIFGPIFYLSEKKYYANLAHHHQLRFIII